MVEVSREFKLSTFKLSRFYCISKINKEQDCPGGEAGCFFPWGWVGFSVTNCKMVGFLPTSFLGNDTQTQVGMFTKFFSVVKEKSNCRIV